MTENTGIIYNIQRFSLNDGPGIRTTVFLKGCMLRCVWCHNPESRSMKKQLMLNASRCIGCGLCLTACEKGLHRFSDGVHDIDRAHCTACGACAAVCAGALETVGRTATVDEVLREVMKDALFYKNSGGGMTLSGGEPLMQPGFTLKLLRGAKEKGLNTAVETCGCAGWEQIEALLPYVDLFLWDVKETDSERHRAFTGAGNALILENLRKLNAAGARIVLRCPVIPGMNDRDAHFRAIGELSMQLKNVERIDVEPYHPLGKGKSESLGEEYPLAHLTFPEDAAVRRWIVQIAAHTEKPVEKA